MIAILPSCFPVKRGISGIESLFYQIGQPHSPDLLSDQHIKNIIISFKDSHNLSLGQLAHSRQSIMVSVLTFLATKFLVLSTITNVCPAFQTTGNLPPVFVLIIHTPFR